MLNRREGSGAYCRAHLVGTSALIVGVLTLGGCALGKRQPQRAARQPSSGPILLQQLNAHTCRSGGLRNGSTWTGNRSSLRILIASETGRRFQNAREELVRDFARREYVVVEERSLSEHSVAAVFSDLKVRDNISIHVVLP